MNIQHIWQQMPERLPFAGYEFRLILRGCFVGYFLTACESKNRLKRKAFKEGIWYEKKPERAMSSVESDYLIKVSIFDDSDESLLEALTLLKNTLIRYGLPLQNTEEAIEETEYIEIQHQRIPYKLAV